jgi:hypothetical protein
LEVITIAQKTKLSGQFPETGMSYRSSHGLDRMMTLASLTVLNTITRFDRSSASMESSIDGMMQSSIISDFTDTATRLVRKGSNFETLLCGLSPPVFWWRPLACIYTF